MKVHRETDRFFEVSGVHRETDRFFEVSGVQLVHSTSVQFHYKHVVFSSELRSKVGNSLTKAASLRITLNIDGAPVVSRSHTHPSHSQTTRLLTSSMLLVLHHTDNQV